MSKLELQCFCKQCVEDFKLRVVVVVCSLVAAVGVKRRYSSERIKKVSIAQQKAGLYGWYIV